MTLLTILILASYAVGVLGAVAALITKRRAFFKTATGAMVVGFALHTAHIVAGLVAEGHLPLFGTQEVCSYLGWALVLYYLIVQTRYPTNALAGLLFPTATLLTLISALAPAITRTPDALAGEPA